MVVIRCSRDRSELRLLICVDCSEMSGRSSERDGFSNNRLLELWPYNHRRLWNWITQERAGYPASWISGVCLSYYRVVDQRSLALVSHLRRATKIFQPNFK